MLEEILVECGNVGACGAIHEYRVEDVHSDDLVAKLRKVKGNAVYELLLVCGKVDAVAAEDTLCAARNADYVELQAVTLHKL